jgi:cell division protein FtsQ
MARARGSARRKLVGTPDRDPHARRAGLVRALAWGGGGAVVVAATLAAVPLVRRVATTHPYFAVREVVVRHRGQLPADAIRAIAGVVPGTNVWSVDCAAVKERLLAQGWIRTADVRRDLPNRIVIQVREYRPAAILALADESPGLYYLAASGRIFAPVSPGDGRDLPYVTGLGRSALGGGDAFGPRAVHRALALLRHADRQHRALGAVSEVHVDRVAGLTLMPVHPAMPIAIGWGQYDEKLARLAEVLPLWSGREAQIVGVSCTFDDEVIVRTRRPAATGGTRPGKAVARAAATGA